MGKINIFRQKRHRIKERFIKNFAAKEFDVEHYVKVSLPYNWLPINTYNYNRINVSDYEATLIDFIENPNKIRFNHPLLIIVGGAGSGKSSSIRYALSQARVCEGCTVHDVCSKNHPERIFIDFIDFKSEVVADLPHKQSERSSSMIKEEKFWHYFNKVLDLIIQDKLSINVEVSDFWLWLITHSKGAYSSRFYKYLFYKKHLFSNYKDNKEELNAMRDDLYNKMNFEETVYYKLSQIAFLRLDSKEVNCNILIFDNIDTLDPFLQVKMIDFAVEANRQFETKAIIPMRPYSFELNRDAIDFIEIIDHWIPEFNKVVEKRFEIFNKDNINDTLLDNSLKSFIDKIFNNKHYRELIDYTTGNSIRFALRNIYNLLLSPLIVTHIDDKEIDVEMPNHFFRQAYFCSETPDQLLYEKNFVNMFVYGNSDSNKNLTLIKLRLLNCINKYESLNLDKIIYNLNKFGYSDIDIKNTLNEFLSKRKAIIWSSSISEYSLDDILSPPNHQIVVTPLGRNYYKELIFEVDYLIECATTYYSYREKSRLNSLKQVIKFIKDLFELDLDEIDYFVQNNSENEYRELFNDKSIMFLIWEGVLSVLKGSFYNIEVDFDKQYEYYIEDLIEKIFIKYNNY